MSEIGMSEAQFRALYRRVKQASDWGPADRRGALNHIMPARVAAAARDVSAGRAVSLAAPVDGEVTADNPEPAVHEMISSGAGRAAGLSFAMDRVAMNIHGNADSHLDALCHVAFDGTLYNGSARAASRGRARPLGILLRRRAAAAARGDRLAG